MSFDIRTRVSITPRLRLRPPELRDAPAIARLAGDREVAATTASLPHPYEEGDARSWLESIGDDPAEDYFEVVRAIILIDGGELVGMSGARITRPHRHAEIGYWLGRPFWGNGYAIEAVTSLVALLLEDLPEIERYFGRVFAGNQRSSAVLEKLGFIHEGTLRKQFMKWDELRDVEFWGSLRENLLEGPPPQPDQHTPPREAK